MKFFFKQMLKVSAFYLEKQKYFLSRWQYQNKKAFFSDSFGFNHLPGDLWAVAALPDNDSFSFSASSSFSSLFITIEMIMNMKTRIPATQPIIMLILLLSMNRILCGSTGVLISVHLLDLEPKIKGRLKKWTEHFT